MTQTTFREITLRANRRAREAFALRVAGKTFREIGEHFSVGRAWASTMVHIGKCLFDKECKE